MYRSISETDGGQPLGGPREKPILFAVRQLRWCYWIDTAVKAITSVGAIPGNIEPIPTDRLVNRR